MQTITVPRAKSKNDTTVIILTADDMHADYVKELIGELPFDSISRHDFKLDHKTYTEATHVLYVDPIGRIKILKERYPINR